MTKEELIAQQKEELRKMAEALMDTPGPDRARALIEVHVAERKLFTGSPV